MGGGGGAERRRKRARGRRRVGVEKEEEQDEEEEQGRETWIRTFASPRCQSTLPVSKGDIEDKGRSPLIFNFSPFSSSLLPSFLPLSLCVHTPSE